MDSKFLATLIQSYQLQNGKKADKELDHYKSLSSLEKIIHHAAMAIAPNGKRSSHQRRLKKVVLEKVRNKLLARRQSLHAAKSFEDVIRIVDECAVPGFGQLTIYDTSLRIGAWLGHLPDLHPESWSPKMLGIC